MTEYPRRYAHNDIGKEGVIYESLFTFITTPDDQALTVRVCTCADTSIHCANRYERIMGLPCASGRYCQCWCHEEEYIASFDKKLNITIDQQL